MVFILFCLAGYKLKSRDKISLKLNFFAKHGSGPHKVGLRAELGF